MIRVGRYVRLKAHEGQRDTLVEHMLGVARFLVDIPGCELYVINTSTADTDTVWVTEVWSSHPRGGSPVANRQTDEDQGIARG